MPVEATVTVTGTDISGAVVTAEPNEFTADGAAKEPAVTVTLDGATLKEGADYTVAYTNNIEPGTATVTVTGAGKYSGTVGNVHHQGRRARLHAGQVQVAGACR